MGTQATVKFFDKNDDCILSLHHQYDGYIKGVGHDLSNWLLTKKITNGYNLEQERDKNFANGIECLALQYVVEFKKRIGGLYTTPFNDEQEYNYEVRYVNNQFELIVYDYQEMLYTTPKDLLNIDYLPEEKKLLTTILTN